MCPCFAFVKEVGAEVWGSTWTKNKVNARNVDSDSGDHGLPPKGEASDAHGEGRVGGEV